MGAGSCTACLLTFPNGMEKGVSRLGRLVTHPAYPEQMKMKLKKIHASSDARLGTVDGYIKTPENRFSVAGVKLTTTED